MAAREARWAAWMELLRLPLAPTVAADLIAGAIAVGESPGLWLLPAFFASAALYAAGMVGNDLVDLPRDRRERPERPLPSGRLSPFRAGRALGALLALGLLLPCLSFPPRAAAAWLLLALAIAAYDLGPRQRAAWAPLTLGLCRALDVLAGGLAASGGSPPTGPLLLMAGLFGAYGAAITLQAEQETLDGRRARLLGLLPLPPVLLLPLVARGWLGIAPLLVLLLEVLWRHSRRADVTGARRLTGAWVRGFLLLGASVALSGGQAWAGAGLTLLWALSSWILLARTQS